MCFAQLTARESLRDIENSLTTFSSKLYHTGLRSATAKSTLAEANEKRNWRIYVDYAQVLIKQARPLYEENYMSMNEMYKKQVALLIRIMQPLRFSPSPIWL